MYIDCWLFGKNFKLISYPSLAMDDVIDNDIMLDLRPLSYGSATELKSIILIPPLSDRLFIDSLRLEYFSRVLSRFDLYRNDKISYINHFNVIHLEIIDTYLKDGALYFVRICIRSLAKCCCAESVGWWILLFSRHHSTCRSKALIPKLRPHCGQISLIGPKLRLFIDLFINGVSLDGIFVGLDGVNRRFDIFDDVSEYILEI